MTDFSVTKIAGTTGFRIGNQYFRLERHDFSDAPEEEEAFLGLQAEMLEAALSKLANAPTNPIQAVLSVSEELAQAVDGPDTEEALDERVGRIAHIAASAVMTIRSELPPYVSQLPMFTRCPVCERFHSPGHCGK